VLGLKPILGREFTESEAARPKVPPSAIIIGYEFWQRKFNGDKNVIGKTLRMSRLSAPLPIVGVMPKGLRFLPDPGAESEPNYDVNAHVDFWFAVTPDESQIRGGAGNAVTRLRPGFTVTQAQTDAATLAAGAVQANPELEGLTAHVRSVPDVLNEEGRRLLLPLFGSVAIMFLIACANVAGLLLARGLERQPEYAMRSALGAKRLRLFRQVVTESLALATVGSILGVFLAAAIVNVLKIVGGHAVPRADAVTIGWPVLAFGVAAALVGAALASLLPAVRASRVNGIEGLKGSRSSASRNERRLLGAVATLQLVLTVSLLAGAALLIRTAHNLASVKPGYDTDHILAMTVTAMQRDKWKEFHTQALERVAAVPGVRHAAFAWGLPLTGNKWPAEIEIAGVPGSTRLAGRINVPIRSITADYFSVLGIQLVEGRGFLNTDTADAPRVAIVNGAFVRRFLGGAAIGRTFNFAGDAKNPVSIVGVIADTRTDALSEKAEPEIYRSFWQNGAFSKHLVVRATGDPTPLAALIRREIRSVDPTAAVERVTTMAEIHRASMAPRTFAMRLLTGFAAAASLLALVGLYGVLSLSVGSRTKEMAVRKAIGAEWSQIVRLILGEGSRLIVIGLVLGTIAAILVGRLLEALLFEVRPADPIALTGAAVLLGLAALVACLLPAIRATRIDLMEALRQE
jgi:putative ABC transport system permease protein